MNDRNYDEAIALFVELGDFNHSDEKAKETKYNQATALAEAGNYDEAISLFSSITDFQDAEDKLIALMKSAHPFLPVFRQEAGTRSP